MLGDLSNLADALSLDVTTFRSFLEAASGNKEASLKFIRKFKSLANFGDSSIV